MPSSPKRNWGRKVAAHCHGDRAAKMAIAAGVDSIEHGTFLKDDTLTEMKKKHVYLVPTLFAGAWVGEHLDTFPPAIAVKARAAASAPRCSRCSSTLVWSGCRLPWARMPASNRMA